MNVQKGFTRLTAVLSLLLGCASLIYSTVTMLKFGFLSWWYMPQNFAICYAAPWVLFWVVGYIVRGFTAPE